MGFAFTTVRAGYRHIHRNVRDSLKLRTLVEASILRDAGLFADIVEW